MSLIGLRKTQAKEYGVCSSAPVGGKRLPFRLRSQSTSGRKHDGGFQVAHDTVDGADRVNAGLSSSWARLQGSQQMRYLTGGMTHALSDVISRQTHPHPYFDPTYMSVRHVFNYSYLHTWNWRLPFPVSPNLRSSRQSFPSWFGSFKIHPW